MDDEDLADAAEAQKVQTAQAFAGLGSSSAGDDSGSNGILGIFKTQGDTMGYKLLRRMGWKDGQGIGPKVRRSARLDMKTKDGDQTHLFAPDDVPMIQFIRKTDRKGLGYQGESTLSNLKDANTGDDEDEDGPSMGKERFSLDKTSKKKAPAASQSGIGVGILNDDGSDDEDPYEIGPKIKYNRTIGGNKKKKGKKTINAASNPSLGNAPVFVSKAARAGNGLRRCYDGRLPIDGFVLAKLTEDLSALMSEYAPPSVPEGWKSAKQKPNHEAGHDSYVSVADAAKASTLDPKSRAALLGEKALPGKSVFDYLSSSTRDLLATASGRSNLPQGGGEIPEAYRLSDEERRKQLWDQVPRLGSDTALAALARSSGGPYADDENKRARYKEYLEFQANDAEAPIAKPLGMSDDAYLRELNEFYNCARIFKPMTGFMASRFTTAKTTLPGSSGGTDEMELLSQPEPKVVDPAEEAAKLGMFGKMTRFAHEFYPTRLLCKRFNVKPPSNSQPNEQHSASYKNEESGIHAETFRTPSTGPSGSVAGRDALPALPAAKEETTAVEVERKVDPEKNEALEADAAHASVLRAIFGDSDSE